MAVEAVVYCTTVVKGLFSLPFQSSLFAEGLLSRCLHHAWSCRELEEDVEEGDSLFIQAELLGILGRLCCKFPQKSHP